MGKSTGFEPSGGATAYGGFGVWSFGFGNRKRRVEIDGENHGAAEPQLKNKALRKGGKRKETPGFAQFLGVGGHTIFDSEKTQQKKTKNRRKLRTFKDYSRAKLKGDGRKGVGEFGFTRRRGETGEKMGLIAGEIERAGRTKRHGTAKPQSK